VTGREVPGPGAIEPELWRDLSFLSPPVCVRCGLPFDFPVELDQACGACLASPPAFDRARAALVYGDVSRDLVLALKHQGRRDGLATFVKWMGAAAGPLLPETDLIVPVPLHYLRLVRRGFNQSVWLAQGLADLSDRPLSVDCLVRARPTPSQGGLSPDGRRRNVQGAFRVRRGQEKRVRDRRILLVDDVFTTGATVEACARTLRRSGASAVDVLTLARVARPRNVPI
jgi:ComF family protein